MKQLVSTALSSPAGKASAAIDAALEAVRKHWIEKEMKQGLGKPDASAVLRGAAAAASASASSSAATGAVAGRAVPRGARAAAGAAATAAKSQPKTDDAGSSLAPPAVAVLAGGAGVPRDDETPAEAAGLAATAQAAGGLPDENDKRAAEAALAQKLSNRSVSRIFSSCAKPLDRIAETDAGSSSDDE